MTVSHFLRTNCVLWKLKNISFFVDIGFVLGQMTSWPNRTPFFFLILYSHLQISWQKFYFQLSTTKFAIKLLKWYVESKSDIHVKVTYKQYPGV